jgi:hypothetical protein
MIIKVALVISTNQIELKEINLDNDEIISKRLDLIGMEDQQINLVLFDESDELDSALGLLKKENKFYPVTSLQALNLSKDSFTQLNATEINTTFQTATQRWILNNNINTIENLYPTINRLKDLWIKDRNSFFEDFWFLIKTNLASTELNIIFHDLKEPTEKQVEKGDKPKLCYSYVQGTRIANLFEGKDKESMLMQEYASEFNDIFNITEYNTERGQLIICAKYELSPILVLAKAPSFNQLQKSLLKSLFLGLNS